MGKNVTILFAAFLVIASLVSGVFFVRHNKSTHKNAGIISDSIDYHALNYTVYLPADKGTIKPGSQAVANGILTYTIHDKDIQEDIAVTEQAKPQDFNYETLNGKREFKTKAGQAYVVDFDERTTGSLVTDKTWLILNAPSSIGAEAMERIIRNLSAI